MTDKNYIYKKLSDGRYIKEIDSKTEHLASAEEDAKLATDIRSLLQGVQGESGTSGTSGESGTSGRDGAKGDIGRTGLTGPRGLNGTSGTSGESGQDGSSGVNGQDGTSGVNGRKGEKGDKGDRGFPGLQGPAGQNGSAGVSGTSGTSSPGFSSGSFGITIDGGGSTITTGLKGYVEIPYSGTITSWSLLADVSGSIVIDVWRDTYATFPPSVADTIAGSEKPTLSSAQKSEDTSLSTWSTSVTAGDIMAFNVESASTLTRVNLSIKITKS
jgi:hypothetical protein